MHYSALNPGVRRREVWAWAMFDFANSGYTTVVITAIFNAYFVSVIAQKAAWGTFAWTAALSVSYVLVIVSAPIVGAYCDVCAGKRRLLVVATLGCVASTAALAWVGAGEVWLAAALIMTSNFFFVTTQNLVAAFLPELAKPEQMGKVSGWGWALGYVGGLVTLGVCLAYVTSAQKAGQPATAFVPVTNLITAGIFGLAALPAFFVLRERCVPQADRSNWMAASFARLHQTLREAGRYKDLRSFLICLIAYQSGVQTVIALAAIYAQEAMGFQMTDTLKLVLVVNVTAALGAFAFGYVQDALGHKRSIALIIVLWIATIGVAWFATDRVTFWVAANLVGVGLGSSQSAARALVGYLSPPDRLAEFYGLWGIAGNVAAVIGPLTYGAVTWVTGNDHRTAMLTTSLFFVLGLVLLKFVDVERGRAAALKAGQ